MFRSKGARNAASSDIRSSDSVANDPHPATSSALPSTALKARIRPPWRRTKSGADVLPLSSPFTPAQSVDTIPAQSPSTLQSSTSTSLSIADAANSSSLAHTVNFPTVRADLEIAHHSSQHHTRLHDHPDNSPFLAAHPPSTTSHLSPTPLSSITQAPESMQAMLAPESTRSDSISDESFAIASKLHNGSSRAGPLHRLASLFRESDGRFEENLRSTKRRIVQVRRQPDSAPVRFQMGFRSRTGWEPIRATKENQDCLIALVPWGPASRYNFFAALDGHGRHGHHCAIFIAERVVAFLRRFLVALASPQFIADTLHRAVAYAEKKLESICDCDFMLSGSTGVFVLIHGSTLYCANVGDSRAVLGREEPKQKQRKSSANTERHDPNSKGTTLSPAHNRFLTVPLSIDHKPARADERDRLVRAGARVDAWESMDLADERVWLPDARTPGLAVSRSFGDLILKPYGVNAIPEVYCLELCEDDRFLVMASDGIFEFISNDEVVEVVGRWRDRGSAQDAAEELVRLATDRWIDDDSVIDDISCVVVFMNVLSSEVSAPRSPRLMETSVASANGSRDGNPCPSSRDLTHAKSSQDHFAAGAAPSTIPPEYVPQEDPSEASEDQGSLSL